MPRDGQRALGSAQKNGAGGFVLSSVWFLFQLGQCDFNSLVKREGFQIFCLVCLKYICVYMQNRQYFVMNCLPLE